jgi:RNA polymerase sigma-70 factor (ECF subfamily)
VSKNNEILRKKGESTEQPGDLAHLYRQRQEVRTKGESLQKGRDSLAFRLRTGSHEAAVELVDIYYEHIYLYMRRLGHSQQMSEDLTQESFLEAWRHIGQLKNDGALNCWLYRIAGNVSRSYWRKHSGKEAASIEGFDIPDSYENDGGIEDFEQFEKLRKAVVALPRKLREVIVLHYMQHLTISEAAEAAGVRRGTFKSRLNRALNALRKQMI